MADIGVLSLQIHSESTQAENSLRRLEGALLAVRSAVNNSGLGRFANSIERIKKAASFDVIGNLHALAAALNQVKRSCDFTIPNISGLNKIKTALDGMNRGATATRETQESLNQMADGFSSVGASVDTASGKVAGFIGEINKASEIVGNFKFDQFKSAFDDWSRMRSQFTLNSGNETALSTGMTSGWEEWKRGAIEAEGTVSEATESINSDLHETQAQIKMLVDESEKWVTVLDAATGEFKKVHIDDYGKPDDSIASTIQIIAGEVELLGNSSSETEGKIEHLLQKLAILREEVSSGKSITGKDLNDKQIVNYKIQIDNLIEKIEHLQSVEANMRDYGSEMVENLVNNYSQIELETMKLEGLKRALAEDIDANKVDTEQIAERTMKIQNLSARIEELKQKEEEEATALKQIASLRESIGSLQSEFSSKMTGGELDIAGVRDYQTRISELMGQLETLQSKQDRLGSSSGMDITNDKARQMAEKFMETNSQLDLMKQRAEEIKILMGNGLATGELDTKGLIRMYAEYGKVTAAIQKAEGEAYGLSNAFSGVRSAVSDLFSPLEKLGKQFLNIAKRMAIRATIRMFIKGMKEGVENMYVWSKAMGTDFAPAMDRAATAILDLKNSLGAMASEALMAFLPVLDEIVDGVIKVINFFNQLFAAINGKDTWMEYVRGSAGAKAFEDTSKAAKGTQKAIKDLLADWDELNIIQSENTSGGSGSGLTYDPQKNGTYRENTIDGLAKGIADVVNFFGGIAGIAAGVAGIWLLKKGDAAFMKYYQDHWPKPEKPSGSGAATQQEIKEAADNAAQDVVSNVKDKIVDAVKENTEATQQLVKAEHEVQKLDVAKKIAQMTNDKLDGMAQLRLGNGQSYMGMTMEQFTAQNPLLAGNRLGLKIDAAKEVGSRTLPNKVDTINLMSGVDTISVDTAKVIENSGTQVNVEATRANVPALESVEDVLKGTDIDWDYTFGDGKDHNNPFGSYVGRHIDYEPHQSYPIPEYPKNWDTTPIDAITGAAESGAKLLEETASATANLTAATETVNESAPLLQEAAQAVEDASHATPGLLPSGSVFAEAYEIPQVDMSSGSNEVIGITDGQSFFWFKAEDAANYGLGNLDWSYAGNNSFVLKPEQPLTAGEKLSGYTFAAKNWAAQHAQEGMMALIAAEFIGQYGKGKKEQREAYSEYYGEEYDKLSGAKKALVHQGYSPEIADALVEATKGALKEYLPGFLGWIPDFAEGAVSLVEDGLVTAGEAAEVVENVLDLGDAAGGIWLNSIFFPESGSVEKGITQALENPITQWVMDVVRDVFSGPDAPEKETVDQALQQYINYKANATGRFEELTSGYGAETEAKFQDWLDQYFGENGVYPDLEKIYEWAINHRPYGVGEDVGNALQETLDLLNYYRNEYLHMVELYEQEYGPYAPKAQYPDTSGKFWNAGMLIAGTPQDMGYGYRPNMAGAGDEADMASATEKGTKAANGELEDNTSETNRLLRQLLQKSWQINLFPTSGWGLFNRNANEAASAVTGDVP